MIRSLALPLTCAALLGASALAPRAALAHGDDGGSELPKRAAPVTKEGEDAVALLKSIEANADAIAVAKDQVDRAWRAIARAEGAKLSGDEEGAKLLSGLALELAKGADALGRAAVAEKRADNTEKEAVDTEQKAARLRDLLAETEAQRVTVSAEIEKARADAKTPPAKPATPTKEKPTAPPKPATPAPAKPATPAPAKPAPAAPAKPATPAPAKPAPPAPAPAKPAAPKPGAP